MMFKLHEFKEKEFIVLKIERAIDIGDHPLEVGVKFPKLSC